MADLPAPRPLPFAPPAAIVRALVRLRRWLIAASRRLIPPHFVVLELATERWRAHALSAFASLGVADQLAAGPAGPAALADALGLDPGALSRLLEALRGEGLVDRGADGRYALNGFSRALTRDHPEGVVHSVIEAGCDRNLRLWGQLARCVRSGERAWDGLFDEPEIWDYLTARPREAEVFHGAMAEMSWLTATSYAAAIEVGDAASVVEVAGGAGQLLAVLLRANPSLRGTLYDLPYVEAPARALLAREGVSDRAEFVPGDLTEGVPAGHDLYVVCNILHGLTDDELRALLVRWREHIRDDSRIAIIEPLPAGSGGYHPSYIDLQMLIESRGGRVRSVAEYSAFLSDAGFELGSVKATVNPYNYVIMVNPLARATRSNSAAAS